MNDSISKFCSIVRGRSEEHRTTIYLLSSHQLTSQVVSILRQELDSMVRVIFLLSQNLEERNHLIALTLTDKKWRLQSNAIVTDRQMVDLSDNLNGWTKSVYKFGCAFIHLSPFHDYHTTNPFLLLNVEEINAIKGHLNWYHDFSLSDELSINSIAPLLPNVFNKIADNLEYYIQKLEQGEIIDPLLI
jgi:hypothetical protein